MLAHRILKPGIRGKQLCLFRNIRSSTETKNLHYMFVNFSSGEHDNIFEGTRARPFFR